MAPLDLRTRAPIVDRRAPMELGDDTLTDRAPAVVLSRRHMPPRHEWHRAAEGDELTQLVAALQIWTELPEPSFW